VTDQRDSELLAPGIRLLWGDELPWQLQFQVDSDTWETRFTYSGAHPVAAGRFAIWVRDNTQLDHDIIEDAVLWLMEIQPDRFNDDEEGPAIVHYMTSADFD
jgi:hypothetical protein